MVLPSRTMAVYNVYMTRRSRPDPARPLREQLLEHGQRQLREGGVRGLSLRAVTAAAGVTPMAAYRHFAGKEALLAAIAADGLRAFAGYLRAAAGARDIRARLLDVCTAYVRFAREHAATFELIFGADIDDRTRHPALFEAGAEAFEIILGVVADCQAAGVLDPRIERTECTASLWAYIHGLCALSRHWPTSGRVRAPEDPRELVERFIGSLLAGLEGAHDE